MLTPLHNLIQNYGLKIDSVIHVGAHYGQEYDQYRANNISAIVFIEPALEAFTELVKHVGLSPFALCVNKACGDKKESRYLWTESSNQGQSNSLLRPKEHTKQYPNIIFHSQQKVEVDTLDNIMHDLRSTTLLDPAWEWFDLLVMDIQGYELHALRGALQELRGIKYIYTEVNRSELYEGCARVEELDVFLANFDFARVETNWAGGTWGDALYIRRPLNLNS